MMNEYEDIRHEKTYFQGMKNNIIAYFTFAENGATIQITKEVRPDFLKCYKLTEQVIRRRLLC